MDFQRLFSLQKELDQKIVHKHNLDPKLLTPKKILALQVEIAELANETKCFKYWSTKGPSEKEVILEEYVDCLHFILSIGLDKDFQTFSFDYKKTPAPLTEQFLNLFIDVNDFVICTSNDNYITLMEDFLSLGLELGFSAEDIEDFYLKKNNINHHRQIANY